MSSVTIGQTLYERRQRTSSFREHTVQKIGRKWIALDYGARCTVDGLLLDCGAYGPRQLYTSIEQCESEAMLGAAWRDLLRDLQSKYTPPDGITVEKINQARRALGLKIFGEDAASANKEQS